MENLSSGLGDRYVFPLVCAAWEGNFVRRDATLLLERVSFNSVVKLTTKVVLALEGVEVFLFLLSIHLQKSDPILQGLSYPLAGIG